MKKLLSALLVLALLISLASCAVPQNTEPPVSENAGVQQLPAAGGETELPEEIPEPSRPEPTEQTEASAQKPTQAPTEEPTELPTQAPTEEPTEPPTQAPTEEPTEPPTQAPTEEPTEPPTQAPTEESTEPKPYSYTGKDEVAAYIHAHGCLPDNFITKSEARALGWRSGSLERYAPGMCIGGDRFYNREGLLPDAPGRYYYECDIDTLGRSSRGAKRIVFSNDGLIYYTDDHYNSFTLLYGEP